MFRFRVVEGLHQDTDPVTGEERTYGRGQEFNTVADLRSQIPPGGGMTPKFEFLAVVLDPAGGPKLSARGTAKASGPGSIPAAQQVGAATAPATQAQTHPERLSAEGEQHKIAAALGEQTHEQQVLEQQAREQKIAEAQQKNADKTARDKPVHHTTHHKPAAAHPHKKAGH